MNTKTRSNQVKSQRRWVLVVALALALVACAIPLIRGTDAANPVSGKNIAPGPPQLAAPTLRVVPTVPPGPQTTVISGTYDPHVFPCATPRHQFTVPAGKTRIVVQVDAAIPTNDLTVSLLFGPDPNPVLITTEDTLTCCEALNYAPPGGVPAGEYQVEICQTPNPNGVPQNAPFNYNGTFTTDDTAIPGGGGGAPPPFGAIPPALQDTGPKIGFENFIAPGVLTPVTTTSAGQQVHSVEYLGRGAGEPSIGNNWKTDVTSYQSDLQTLFVTFNDTCPSSGQSSTWVNRSAPTSQAVDSDPIGFTDPQTGRTFAGELTLLSPDTCKTSYTDDDGLTWIPTQGSGIASGVDHETIGGGPYRTNLTGVPPVVPPPHPTYANAVYYCSQEGVPNTGPPSFCSRSDNGGLTFGPSVPLATPPINVCGGLHGHVKVSPKDGAVYVPFNQCNGVASAIVSLDNGITWTIRHVQNGSISMQPSLSFQDPAIGIDSNGRVYYIIANADTAAAVLTSDDYGATWQNLGDVGAVYGLKNIRYPAAVAGDAGRAAVAFYGTTTAGDALQPTFDGLWHLYVANTFDGGHTWTTTDATPNAPMQRGCIWAKGGANICRNLLDFFDMTIDREGRVLVGYVNGCEGGNCAQAAPTAKGNAYTTAATIARQSSGRRLIASHDGPVTTKPGMPSVTERRVGNIVHLGWSEADTGNLNISRYQIRRGTVSGGETLLTTVPGTQTGGTYDDVLPANDTTTYYYKVRAVNSAGASCGNNEVAAPYIGTTCTGIIIHQNDPAHPEANAGTATPASLLIDYIAVGEPPGSSNFLFKMKVNDLSTVPPNSRWRIVWDSFSSPGQQYYVGMRTSPDPQNPQNQVVSFEYGYLADAGVPAVFVISEQSAIPADPASNYKTDGTITIIAPKSAFGNPQPGDLLGAVNGRTLTADTPETNKLERSNAFVDHTFVKAQTDNSYPAATYTVVGNVPCGPPTLPCSGTTVEDNDPHIAYSDGWHMVKDPNASAGHYRLNDSSDGNHSAVLFFNNPANQAGSITYFYATSPKGGSADIYMDGAKVGTVNYFSSTGSAHSPVFGVSTQIAYKAAAGGNHKLEVRPTKGRVYIDGFCLGQAKPTGQPSSHPGDTDDEDETEGPGQESTHSMTVGPDTQSISISAMSSVDGLPLRLMLIDPNGALLQMVDTSSGVAILEAPVTQSGIYVIKVINLGIGPVQVWSLATPLVSTPLVSRMSNGPTIERREGTPQGGLLSPLWSNILLEVYERVLASYV